MPNRKNIIEALSICAPETQDDSKLECSDCPYVDVCDPNDTIGITLPLILDIRALLKEQEAVEPDQDSEGTCTCGNCGETIGWYPVGCKEPVKLGNFCPYCGRAVKWE